MRVQNNLRVFILRTNVACDTRLESELDEEEDWGRYEAGYALLERVEEHALDRRQVDRAPVDRHEAPIARSPSATHLEASAGADARVGAPRGFRPALVSEPKPKRALLAVDVERRMEAAPEAGAQWLLPAVKDCSPVKLRLVSHSSAGTWRGEQVDDEPAGELM